jgi:hypothetical protein
VIMAPGRILRIAMEFEELGFVISHLPLFSKAIPQS